LAAKTLEVSAQQGHEGNVTWLKRQLREAQDTIMQLREAQRVSEEQNMKTPQGARSSRGESSACRRGMIGELCFVFSDVTQNFSSFPFL
jgi:hypothetical protein